MGLYNSRSSNEPEAKHLLTTPSTYVSTFKKYLLIRPSNMDEQVDKLFINFHKTDQARFGYNIYSSKNVMFWDVIAEDEQRNFCYHKLIEKQSFNHVLILITPHVTVREVLEHAQLTYLKVPAIILAEHHSINNKLTKDVITYTESYKIPYHEINTNDIEDLLQILTIY